MHARMSFLKSAPFCLSGTLSLRAQSHAHLLRVARVQYSREGPSTRLPSGLVVLSPTWFEHRLAHQPIA